MLISPEFSSAFQDIVTQTCLLNFGNKLKHKSVSCNKWTTNGKILKAVITDLLNAILGWIEEKPKKVHKNYFGENLSTFLKIHKFLKIPPKF